MPQELGPRRQDELLLVGGHRGEPLALPDRIGQFLARPFCQIGFLIEELNLGGAARLGEKDHAFGFRGEMRQPGEAADGVALGLGCGGALEQAFERHGTEADSGALAQEIAAGDGLGMREKGVHGGVIRG